MSISIINGNSALVKATFKDSQGNICNPVANVAWTTSDGTIASVSASNLSFRTHFDRAQITAISSGTATITATSKDAGNSTITATISVTTYDNLPSTVAINVIP